MRNQLSKINARLRCGVFGARTPAPFRGLESASSSTPVKGRATTRDELDRVVSAFRCGYNIAIQQARTADIVQRVDDERTVSASHRGFAYEGAAMGVAMLDLLCPWRRRGIRELLDRKGVAHLYMIHVGAGWAAARLRRHPSRLLRQLDPLYTWLAVDGYGFALGYSHPRQTIDQQRIPTTINGYGRRAFDQGLGRCLWFHACGDMDALVAAVRAFPKERQSDLFSGVGLACTYAGGVDESSIERLRMLACDFTAELAQGAAFAAKVRERAGNPVDQTDRCCRKLCGTSARRAAAITDEMLPDRHDSPDLCPSPNGISRFWSARQLTGHDGAADYERWRQRIQHALAPRKQTLSREAVEVFEKGMRA